MQVSEERGFPKPNVSMSLENTLWEILLTLISSGVTLRDSHGIALVKVVTGKSCLG